MWIALNQRLKKSHQERGQVAEWLKAADCKSARVCVRWFESSPVHHLTKLIPSKCTGRERGRTGHCDAYRARLRVRGTGVLND